MQETRVYAGLFDADETTSIDISSERFDYVHLARGSVNLNGPTLQEGDGVKVCDENG